MTEPPSLPALEQALALYEQLRLRCRTRQQRTSVPFPRAALALFRSQVAAQAWNEAQASAHAALSSCGDTAAILIPVVTTLLRARAFLMCADIIKSQQQNIDPGLAELLLGKSLLAAGDINAIHHLRAACAVPEPYFEARLLLPQALRRAGAITEANASIISLSQLALYPHGPLAQLAEWAWDDGERDTALSRMATAIEAAPLRRRGRLRTRRAEWLAICEQYDESRAELQQALQEDPAYTRAADVLGSLPS